MLVLLSDSYGPALKLTGGFGTQRQNDTPKSSGAPSNTITDHAFGRAFDFSSILPVNHSTERKYEKNLNKITTKEGYQYQLNLFLAKLNAMPLHLIPDFICVSAKFVDASYDTYTPKTTSLDTKYTNLKYVKLKRDFSGHDDHIHVSFSPARGGIYNGQGSLTSASSNSSSESNENGIEYQDSFSRIRRISSTNLLTKDYTNNSQQISPEDIFNALVNVGLFTPEAAAIFVGLANRESQRKLYIVQEKWGAIGLWQISTAIKDGGSANCQLLLPEKFQTQYWKLALPDKQDIPESSIDAEINARCASGQPGFGIDKFDKRLWNLTNQVYLLRSKINRFNFKQPVQDLPIEPWGDNYLKYGFISSTNYSNMQFEDVLSVYQKMTNKSEGTLRDWIMQKVKAKSRKSNTLNQDSKEVEKNGKTFLENWFNGTKYLAVFE